MIFKKKPAASSFIFANNRIKKIVFIIQIHYSVHVRHSVLSFRFVIPFRYSVPYSIPFSIPRFTNNPFLAALRFIFSSLDAK